MTLARTIRKLHKIAAFAVGIQLLLWMVSGLYMTAVPIDLVRGEHLVAKPSKKPLTAHVAIPIPKILALYPQTTELVLLNINGVEVYRVKERSKTHYINAQTGQALAPLTKDEARNAANNSYQGEGAIAQINWLTKPYAPSELGNRALPVWQVVYDDIFESTLYISAYSGEVSAVRSDIWRIFDFLWMLHIMDYDEREDFNNPLVILMASIGCLLVLSGLLMLLQTIKRKGWQFSR